MSASITDPHSTAASPGSPAQPLIEGRSGRGRLVLRRFLRHRLSVIGLVCIVALYALAFLGPLVTPWGYAEQDPTAYLSPPSAQPCAGPNLSYLV